MYWRRILLQYSVSNHFPTVWSSDVNFFQSGYSLNFFQGNIFNRITDPFNTLGKKMNPISILAYNYYKNKWNSQSGEIVIDLRNQTDSRNIHERVWWLPLSQREDSTHQQNKQVHQDKWRARKARKTLNSFHLLLKTKLITINQFCRLLGLSLTTIWLFRRYLNVSERRWGWEGRLLI